MAFNFKSDVNLNTFKITNLGTPTANTDAVNKGYVDSIAEGLDVKASVRVATTANLAATRSANVLTADSNGAIIVDGVTLSVNDRILVKNQTTGADNGIYSVTTAGDGSNTFVLTRTADADNSPSGEVTAGLFTFIEEGIVNGDSGWTLTTDDPITLNTTALVFTQFSGAGNILGGAGLVKTGSTLDVGDANKGVQVNTDNVQVAGSEVAASGFGLEVNFTNDWQLNVKLDTTKRTAAGINDVANNPFYRDSTGLNIKVDGSTVDLDSGNGNRIYIPNGGVTATQLNSSVAGDGIAGGAGTALSVDHDGQGLAFSSNQLVLELDGTTLSKSSNGLKINSSLVPQKYVFTNSTAASTFTVNHALNTTSVVAQIIEVSSGNFLFADISVVDADNISVTFGASQSSGTFRVIVIG